MLYHNEVFLATGQYCKYEIQTPVHKKNNLEHASIATVENMPDSTQHTNSG